MKANLLAPCKDTQAIGPLRSIGGVDQLAFRVCTLSQALALAVGVSLPSQLSLGRFNVTLVVFGRRVTC